MSTSTAAVPSGPSLRLWSGDPDDSAEYRTSTPVLQPFTFRNAIERLQEAHGHASKASTWKQYATILRYWEAWHEGPGPSVEQITQEMLSAFLASVDAWGTAATWQRVDGQIGKVLKSCCPQSRANKIGMREPRIASIDLVPFVPIPTASWFREHRQPGAKRNGGHVPKRRGELTLPQFQRVLDACWMGPHAAFLETVLAWWWFSGMRFAQTLQELPWSDDGVSEGIDLSSGTLVTSDSKCGGEIRVPIPQVLMPGLRLLHSQATSRLVFRRDGCMRKVFRRLYDLAWFRAFPAKDPAERAAKHWSPHQLRAVSVSTWDMLPRPACEVGWLVTGHSPGNVRQAHYSRPTDEQFRKIVDEIFPMPSLRAGTIARQQALF